MAAESTSFIQFDYCNLCKISHKKQKKHLYSKRHQEILQNILKKFSKKIKDAKSCINNPAIETLGWENGAQFWCYFCEMEIDKHGRVIDATVKYGGLLQHIASKEHVKKAGEFFWKNIIDKNKKNNYILREVEAERFSNKSETALTVYRQKMNTRIQQIADKIRIQTNTQDQFTKPTLVKAPPWSQMCTKQTQISQHASLSRVTPCVDAVRSETSEVPRRKIIQAVGVGLTSIVKPVCQTSSSGEKEEVGNVFTGATPPWLMEEEEQTGGGEIGPSMSEYDKHLKREKKKKLPPNRVGAKFDHTSQTAATWMPSFGGVWHQGRRLNSKIQFDKRFGIKGQSRPDMMQPFTRSSRPSTIVPYKRKNKAETNPTVTEVHLISSPLVDPRPSAMLKTSQHQQSVLDYSHHGDTSVIQAISSQLVPDTFHSVQSPHLSAASVSGSVLLSGSAPVLQTEPSLTHSRNTSSVCVTVGCVSESARTPVPVCAAQTHTIRPKSNTDVNQREETLRHTHNMQVKELVVNKLTSTKETVHSDQTTSENQKTKSTDENYGIREDRNKFVGESNNKDSREIQTKRALAPSTQQGKVIPYKRKKKHVHSSDTPTPRSSDRSSSSDVGQMFTQACDMAFRQQTQGSGNFQACQSSQNYQFGGNRNIYQQNPNEYRNQNSNQFPQGQQWIPQAVPRQHFPPQYGNNSSCRNPGHNTPQFIHSTFVNPRTVYPGVHRGVTQPPIQTQRLAAPPAGGGAGVHRGMIQPPIQTHRLAAPPAGGGAGVHRGMTQPPIQTQRLAAPPAGGGAGVSQTQSPSSSGGLNLFQSISAAIGTKLPN